MSHGTGVGSGLVAVDELVSITMDGSCVRIESCEPLNGFGTCVVIDAMNAAVDAGSVVSIGRRDVAAQPSPPIGPARCDRRLIPVAASGAGVAVVRSEGSTWMIDMSRRRFVRSDHQLDLHFVPSSAWTPFVELWLSADAISARTTDDRYVTSRRSCCTIPAIGAHVPDVRIQLIAS
jgi:hypothetical protein